MQPEDQEAWASATSATLSQTNALASSMRSVLAELESKEVAQAGKAHEQRLAMKGAAELEAIESRIVEVKEMIKKVGDSFLGLQHESKAKWGQLKVCEQRLELRSKRPESECFKDNLQDVLEAEKKTLAASRAELQACAKELKEKIEALNTVCDYLQKDVTQKRNSSGSGKPQKSVSLPQLTKTQTQSFVPVQDDPILKAMSPQERLLEARKREDAALHASKKGNEMILRISEECNKVLAKVEACLAKKVAEVSDMKKKLHEQMKEVDSILKDAERAISRIKREERLKEKEKTIEKAESMVADLRVQREKLTDDFRNKTIALQLEQSCKLLIASRVDARRAESKSKVPSE